MSATFWRIVATLVLTNFSLMADFIIFFVLLFESGALHPGAIRFSSSFHVSYAPYQVVLPLVDLVSVYKFVAQYWKYFFS